MVLWSAPALAQVAEPTPTPTPTPTATPTPPPGQLNSPGPASSPGQPTPNPDAATNNGIWDGFNTFAIYCEDIFLGLLPSTPDWLKLSTLVGVLQQSFPFAPWYLLHQLVAAFTFVMGAALLYKTVDLFWP